MRGDEPGGLESTNTMKRLAVLGLIVAAVVVSQSTDPRVAVVMLVIFGFGFYLSYVRARGS